MMVIKMLIVIDQDNALEIKEMLRDFFFWMRENKCESVLLVLEGKELRIEFEEKHYSDKYRQAIEKTINDNLHLADGENCTLIDLKRAIGME